MTDKIYVYNGSTFEEIDEELILSIEFDQKGNAAIDKLTVLFDRTVLAGSAVPVFFNEIRFEIDGVVVFGGRVSIPEDMDGLYKVTCYSYGEEFLDKIVNEVYDEGDDIAEIFEDLIDNYTDLTYIGVASTSITITDRLVFRERPLSDCLQFLATSLFYQIKTNYLKQVDFQPQDDEDSGITLEFGENVVMPIQWDRNSNDVVTKIRLEGDEQTFNTSESFTASASQTTFTLAYEPLGNIIVTVDGTEQEGQVSGNNEGDYTVKNENKQIIFNDALTGGEAVVIQYEYLRPIKVEAEIELLDEYGEQIIKERFVKNKFIKSYPEARQYAQKYLATYGQPNLSGSPIGVGYYPTVSPGKTVRCVDSYNEVDEVLSITNVRYLYPERESIITVGRDRTLIWDWQREVMQKIQEGASKDANVDILQNYRKQSETVKTQLTPSLYAGTRNYNDSWVWGKSIWGQSRWGDRRDGDNFTSYDSTFYQLSNFWDGAGLTVSAQQLVLGSGQAATYTGRDGSGEFVYTNGKAIIEFDGSLLGGLDVFLRYADSSNNVKISLGPSSIIVAQTVSGSTQTLSTTTGISLTSESLLTMRLFDNLRIYNETGTVNLDISVTYQEEGSFRLASTSAQQLISEVKLHTGD